MPRPVADLTVGEAERRRGGMGLVAEAVLRLLRRGAVVAQAVRFDDEAEGRPVEVDLEAVDQCLRLGLRETRLAGDR